MEDIELNSNDREGRNRKKTINTNKIESDFIETKLLEDSSDEKLPIPNDKQQLNYMKTVKRRGNVYVIRDSITSEDDPLECDVIDTMTEDLYNEVIKMSTSANRKASFFKFIFVITNLYVIMTGAVIGVLTLNDFGSSIPSYIASILGFSITAVLTILTTFSVSKRGVLLKDISNRSRRIARDIKVIQNSNLPRKERLKKINEKYQEVDELDLAIFDNSVNSMSSKSKGVSVTEPSVKRSNSPHSEEFNKSIKHLDDDDKNSNEDEKSPRFISRKWFRSKSKISTPTTLTQTDAESKA